MEKFPTQPGNEREKSEGSVEHPALREKSNTELFAIRLMEDELRSYEKNWEVGGTLGAGEKRNIGTMRQTLQEGDYTLVLGQLFSEKGALLENKENPDSKFNADARVRDIDRIIKTLGYQEFPEAKKVTEQDVAIYLDSMARELADFGRNHGGDIKYMKKMMQESDSYLQLSNEILNPSGENGEMSEEARKKVYEVLQQKEIGFRSRRAGSEYATMANGEGNLEAYRNPSPQTEIQIKDLKKEIEQALRVGAMANLFEKSPEGGAGKEAKEAEERERKLQQLRSEMQRTAQPLDRPQSEEERLRESRNKIDSMTINAGVKKQEKKEELPGNLGKIKHVLNNYVEQSTGRPSNQVDSMTPAVEGFKMAYPEENDCLSRINEVAKIYGTRVQEELKTDARNEGGYAKNRALEYIVSSVLTQQERAAFDRVAKQEEQRQYTPGMRMVGIVPLKTSLRDLFEAIA